MPASRAIEPGTSAARATMRSTRLSNASLERPVRSIMRLRFCGLLKLATVESVWSLNATDRSAPSEPPADLVLRVEIVGLVTEMKARIRREPRPQRLHRFEQSARIVAAAKTRFPRPCRGMKDRCDAVADRLAVAIDKRDIEGEVGARARHHLPLEGVAMQIDDARQRQEAPRVQFERLRPRAESTQWIMRPRSTAKRPKSGRRAAFGRLR